MFRVTVGAAQPVRCDSANWLSSDSVQHILYGSYRKWEPLPCTGWFCALWKTAVLPLCYAQQLAAADKESLVPVGNSSCCAQTRALTMHHAAAASTACDPLPSWAQHLVGVSLCRRFKTDCPCNSIMQLTPKENTVTRHYFCCSVPGLTSDHCCQAFRVCELPVAKQKQPTKQKKIKLLAGKW